VWDRFHFNLYAQQFLATQNWWGGATTNVPGLEADHVQIVNFVVRAIG
jgi:polyhydroxyalkanoate synthase